MTSAIPNAALIPPGVGPAGSPRAPAPAGSPAGPGSATSPAAPPASAPGPSFAELLAQRSRASERAAGVEHLQFSRHALQRLQQRDIALSQPTLERLAGGVARAASKGSRDSVVFVDDTAFVVSVANRTVITAVGTGHMREQVFTNIDSAVIA